MKMTLMFFMMSLLNAWLNYSKENKGAKRDYSYIISARCHLLAFIWLLYKFC